MERVGSAGAFTPTGTLLWEVLARRWDLEICHRYHAVSGQARTLDLLSLHEGYSSETAAEAPMSSTAVPQEGPELWFV